MSKSRHGTDPAHVRAVAIGFSSGYRWRSNASDWGQLVRAHPGVIRVRMGTEHFTIPPHQAVWIPATVPHEVDMSGRGVLQRVYLRAPRGLPARARVIAVSPLLRELLRRVHRLGTLRRGVPGERHLMDVLLDELVVEPVQAMSLPMPADPRARRAAEYLRTHAGSTLQDATRASGASLRTLERLFHAQTGLSLGAWQQRARLMASLALLADGATVTAAGLAIGYASTSAFVSAFRRATGTTPGRYFRPRTS